MEWSQAPNHSAQLVFDPNPSIDTLSWDLESLLDRIIWSKERTLQALKILVPLCFGSAKSLFLQHNPLHWNANGAENFIIKSKVSLANTFSNAVVDSLFIARILY